MKVCKSLVIRGHVQGVGFRAAMMRKAQALNITGWVRNLPGGEVEAVVEGPPEAVEAIIAWSRRGPPGAGVVAVEVREAKGGYTRFDVRW
ncbi:MAG: acylphosphatase [Azospira oryzae]|nr:MAG: acylphosphatase [Azospira oryzae]PZP82129.1 MAG: acylphosphatase [Azospira oryzae]